MKKNAITMNNVTCVVAAYLSAAGDNYCIQTTRIVAFESNQFGVYHKGYSVAPL